MGADGALGRGLLGGEDVSAVEADPAGVHVADKELVVPQEPGEAVEAVGVDLFNFGDLAEVALNGREALLLGLLGEEGVRLPVLVQLVLPGQLQELDRKSVV